MTLLAAFKHYWKPPRLTIIPTKPDYFSFANEVFIHWLYLFVVWITGFHTSYDRICIPISTATSLFFQIGSNFWNFHSTSKFWEKLWQSGFRNCFVTDWILIKKDLSVAPTDPTGGGGIRGMGTGGYIQRVLYTFVLCLIWQMNQTITL